MASNEDILDAAKNLVEDAVSAYTAYNNRVQSDPDHAEDLAECLDVAETILLNMKCQEYDVAPERMQEMLERLTKWCNRVLRGVLVR